MRRSGRLTALSAVLALVVVPVAPYTVHFGNMVSLLVCLVPTFAGSAFMQLIMHETIVVLHVMAEWTLPHVVPF